MNTEFQIKAVYLANDSRDFLHWAYLLLTTELNKLNSNESKRKVYISNCKFS